jgi:hypothetical protein
LTGKYDRSSLADLSGRHDQPLEQATCYGVTTGGGYRYQARSARLVLMSDSGNPSAGLSNGLPPNDDSPEKLFADVVAAALQEDEVRQGLNETPDLSEGVLATAITARRQSVLEAVNVEQKVYEKACDGLHRRPDKASGEHYGPLTTAAIAAATLLIMLLIASAPVTAVIWLDSVYGSSMLSAILLVVSGIGIAIGLVIAIIAIFPEADGVITILIGLAILLGLAGIGWMVSTIGGSWPWALVSVATFLAVVVGLIAFSRRTPRSLLLAREQIAGDAYRRWAVALRDKGVLPAIRDVLNASRQDQYSIYLTIRNAPGLGRGTTRNLYVETPAVSELTSLLRSLGRASVAISGPRGVGKTELLQAYCQGRYTSFTGASDLAILVSAPVQYDPRDFVLHLYATTCQRVLSFVHELQSSSGNRPLQARWQDEVGLKGYMNKSTLFDSDIPLATDIQSLSNSAATRLVRVRHLQTIGGEVSGTLGTKWLGLGTKESMSWAAQPLTYPEIVTDLTNFLQETARVLRLSTKAGKSPSRVLVAIDELDRMGSGDHVRAFLNEVKAIFMAEGCFFLVSVSEDALRSFDLSGVGTREVFDSAFDEIIRVDYLSHALASSLLRKYVVGLSEQYIALVYVLSGGVARELLRVTRSIVEMSRGADKRLAIHVVVSTLVRDELSRTCRAVRDALLGIRDKGSLATLIRIVDEYPSAHCDYDALTAYILNLRSVTLEEGTDEDELRESLVARICFLATIVAVFHDYLDANRMRWAVDVVQSVGRFESLARARRYVAVNPNLAIDLMHEFRSAWELDRKEMLG